MTQTQHELGDSWKLRIRSAKVGEDGTDLRNHEKHQSKIKEERALALQFPSNYRSQYGIYQEVKTKNSK